ncbi:MAG: hypothetical protein IKU72_02355 [Oscillospiraceae bacterium]|nr:hypothetical protein [Oscillospiraceae bacterium]
MTTPQIIIGVLAVAIITAGLYIWGLRKSMMQQQDLNRQLLSACGSRVVKALKKQFAVTEADVAKIIEGITVGPAWSRNKIKVEDGKKFSPQVIAFLLDQLYIEKNKDGSYKLK